MAFLIEASLAGALVGPAWSVEFLRVKKYNLIYDCSQNLLVVWHVIEKYRD